MIRGSLLYLSFLLLVLPFITCSTTSEAITAGSGNEAAVKTAPDSGNGPESGKAPESGADNKSDGVDSNHKAETGSGVPEEVQFISTPQPGKEADTRIHKELPIPSPSIVSPSLDFPERTEQDYLYTLPIEKGKLVEPKKPARAMENRNDSNGENKAEESQSARRSEDQTNTGDQTNRGETEDATTGGEPRSRRNKLASAESGAGAPGDNTPNEGEQNEGKSNERKPNEGNNRRSVRAVPGDSIDLFFSGKGWVYDRGRSKADGVDFQERFHSDDETEFIFKVRSTGNYQLTFLKQNINTGEREKKVVDVLATEQREIPTIPTSLESGEEKQENELRKETPQSIARAVERENIQILSEQVDTLVVWAAGGAEAQPSVSETNTAGVETQTENAETGTSNMSSKTASPDIALKAAELLYRKGEEEAAKKVLLAGLNNASLPRESKERIYFLLGRLHEAPGPVRDERKAVEFYRECVRLFPAGKYQPEARDRMRRLERYYLEVR